MGDANPTCTLGDYSKPSHEGYKNTIELLVWNNVVPLRSDTIRLVQNGCLFHGLWSGDPNQHLKDFLKFVDSLDLNGSITTYKDLTTHFLSQFFPPGRTAKLRNDILMFQQHHGESLSKAWTRFKDLLQKVPHHGIDLWLKVQIFYDHVNPVIRLTIDQSDGGKLRDKNAKESRALLEDLALYDNEGWNDPRDFAKSVKAISLPQDVPSTSDHRLIELKNQVQRLMEAHLDSTQPTEVNKITSSCEICSGPHDTQYCMENPKQAFVEYASSYVRLSKFKADFKQQQSEMTNKIDIVLKAITDRMAGALPSDTVKNPKLNVNTTTLVLSARSYPTEDPQCSFYPSTSINAVKTCSKEASHSHTTHTLIYNAILDKYVESLEIGKNGSAFVQGEVSAKMEDPGLFTLPCRLGDSKPFDILADLGSCVNIIPLYLFKKLNIRLLEEIDHIFVLPDGTKSYPVRIAKDVEVRIGKLKPLNDFYVIDMKKDPETPLLVGSIFLATANAVIDCRKAKIAIGKRITRTNHPKMEMGYGMPKLGSLTRMEKNSPKPFNQSPLLESSPKEKVQGRSST
uniref:Zinc finger, CCHC-type n=1 Tax=Tanacetum cinerariifolium TaxID=118510 RepID=A0A6L2N3K0_TANCI|nr:zinc finger, CCHC-type [Tanacetum cinerariifolium]